MHVSSLSAEVDTIEPLLHSAMVEQRRGLAQLPPWEQKMKAAQNVLFNQEVFAQVTTRTIQNS